MSAQDRYAFAISLLDGDRQARKILADLLEEDGERGLAQWARQGGNRKQQRLDLVLMLLPCRQAIGLVSEFVFHAFTSRADLKLLAMLPQQIGRWLAGKIDDQQIAEICRGRLQSLPSDWGRPSGRRRLGLFNGNLRVVIEELAAAIQCAINADLAARGALATGTPRSWHTTSVEHLRMVAAACQNQMTPARDPRKPTEPSLEINWQIARTKTLLEHLLTGPEPPWPK
jgi:hypothetical protein